MNIIVIVRHIPDLVEELEIADTGLGLNRDFLKFVVNEFDDQALEQALLLKEQAGGSVTALAIDTPDIDQTLFTCLAKGADRALKLTGDFAEGVSSHGAARIFAEALKSMPYDLVVTGVQSAEDLDGQLAPLLAGYLGVPHVSVVTSAMVSGQTATVRQEYSGGIMAEFAVDMPAVLGIQAAAQPPRYAPISRVRAIMKEKKLDMRDAVSADGAGLTILRMAKPESTAHAEMIEGDSDAIAERILAVIAGRGLLKK